MISILKFLIYWILLIVIICVIFAGSVINGSLTVLDVYPSKLAEICWGEEISDFMFFKR